MQTDPLHILAVVGSLGNKSSVRTVIVQVSDELKRAGIEVDLLDLGEEKLPQFHPDTSYHAEHYPALKDRVHRADVLLLGTPDYHGTMSSGLKNFLDHFWGEYAGKLFATVVASHDKGLTVTDHIRTVARQCYAWSMPYAVAFAEGTDVKDGQIINAAFRDRLAMFVRDLGVYGKLLAQQRRADLAGTEPGFLARHRKK